MRRYLDCLPGEWPPSWSAESTSSAGGCTAPSSSDCKCSLADSSVVDPDSTHHPDADLDADPGSDLYLMQIRMQIRIFI
jgi:hypothetical protein